MKPDESEAWRGYVGDALARDPVSMLVTLTKG
jgi:hypothetical protein